MRPPGFADAVRLAGHSCPTVAGAWLMTVRALRVGHPFSSAIQTVARELNVPVAEVLEMESRLSGRDIGFDAPADEDDDHSPPAPMARAAWPSAA